MSSDPVNRLTTTLDERPALAAAIGLVFVIVLLYSLFVSQELFIALWFFAVLFLAYLTWRFVRAFELLARAVDQYVTDHRDPDTELD